MPKRVKRIRWNPYKGRKRTFVCFEHRRTARRFVNDEQPRCPDCGEPMYQLTDGPKDVPPRKDIKAWRAFRRAHRRSILRQIVGDP